MIKVSKSKLKAKMLEYFRRVGESGEEIIVTDHGKPVLKVSPLKKRESAEEIFRRIRGKVVYHEDILRPTTEEWLEL